jgi:integrase
MSNEPKNKVLSFPSRLVIPRGNVEAFEVKSTPPKKPSRKQKPSPEEKAARATRRRENSLLGYSPRKVAELTFTTAAEAKDIRCPPGLKHIEAWHTTSTYLGVRTAPPRKRDGGIHQVWIARFKSGAKHTKQNLGRTSHMNYDEAHYQALRLRRIGAARPDDVVVESLKEAYDSYCLLRQKDWSQATIDDYAKAIEIVKDWHPRQIDGFRPKEMTDRFHKIAKEVAATKKAQEVGYDGIATAISVMRLMRTIFNDAIANHIIRHNPVSALVRSGAFKRRQRKAAPFSFHKLPEFWRWVHSSTTGSVRDYILVGLLTGMRRSVLSSLQWKYYNNERGSYALVPDQRGNKTRQRVELPLPQFLLDTVFRRRYKDKNNDPWILPSVRYPGQPCRSVKGALKSLEERIGVRVTPQTLRRVTASTMQRATGDYLLVKRLLTHNIDTAFEREMTSGEYVLTEADQLLEGMNKTVEYIFAAIGEPYPYKKVGVQMP